MNGGNELKKSIYKYSPLEQSLIFVHFQDDVFHLIFVVPLMPLLKTNIII